MELLIFYKYCAVLALFYVVLSFNVVLNRRKHSVGLGDGQNIEVTKAIRIHGNFCENIVLLLFLTFLTINKGSLNTIETHIVCSLLIISRIMHFVGISKSHGVSAGRFIGTVIIYVIYLFMAIKLIL